MPKQLPQPEIVADSKAVDEFDNKEADEIVEEACDELRKLQYNCKRRK